MPLVVAGGAYGRGWAGAIYPYVKSVGVYRCPDGPNDTLGYDVNASASVTGSTGSTTSWAAPAGTVLLFEASGDATTRPASATPETTSGNGGQDDGATGRQAGLRHSGGPVACFLTFRVV